MTKRATKRQIRERRRAKAKRRDMYSNDVVGLDLGSVEARVLATMDQNQGFKTGEDIYGGHPIGSPERNALKAKHYLDLYGSKLGSTCDPTRFEKRGCLTGRHRCDD